MKEKKAGVRLIQIVSLAILFGSALWTIQRVAMVSQINSEAVYWERARFFLGQGGASLYSGSSICSLGYSLILFPICALIKSPYAAYKAAILLNGIFLCGAYLCAVAAANKLFSEERKSFLSVACFFTVFCPALALSRTYTGPEMAVLLLTWFSVYLLTLLWERYRRSALILLTVSLCLIGFLQITALGMIIAIAVMLGFFVKKGKMEETSFLYCILALLLGLAAGNIAERVVISMFSKEMDITTASSSLEVFFDGISTGWENGYLYGLLSAITGKLYSVLAGTFLLACPALWNLCKCIGKQRMKKGDTDESDKSAELDKSGCFLPDALTGIFLIQLLFISIYDHSKGLDSGFLSLSGLEMVLSILVLIGLVQLKNEKDWEKTLCGYLLLFCVCTFATAQTLQDAGTGSISSENAGVLMLFQNADMTPVSIVYMAACVVLLISLLFTAFLRGATGKRRLDCFFRIFGCSAFTVLFAVANVFIVDNNVGTANETYLESVAPIASLLSETSADSACVYLRDGSTDREIILLQSLLPDQSIRLIANNTEARTAFFEELEQDTEDVLVLTGTSESNIRDIYSEALTGYEIVYLTKSYALWARNDSVICGGLENAVLARV
ncbi:MAG: hypothetical protein LIO94_08640, partial [Clostridiales bacterium]|nr:hypothetical protein [Clostridiales bacterium]